MISRGARLTAALAALVATLFLGRWLSALLADRWWTAAVAPGAAGFHTEWHVLRLTLEIGGILVASAWFIGHLLVVHRAIGSVQIPRHVANLEFREALTPRVLLAGAVLAGAVFGILVGTGSSRWWDTVALAWHGAIYGMADPLLGHDAGLYVAQLPAWRAAHASALFLVLLALGGVLALYVVIGAIQWIQGRPAINDHARAHLGWLLVALALVLAWGYLLEPYEFVAGIDGPPDRELFELTTLVSPALVGTALMVAVLSGLWALRPRHTLVAAGWVVLGLASVGGHWLLPSLAAADDAEPLAEAATVRRFETVAYGLELLRDSTLTAASEAPVVPPSPSYWDARLIRALARSDTTIDLTVDPAAITVRGVVRPVWLSLRTAGRGGAVLEAIADDRLSVAGDPLYYRAGDTLPYPTRQPFLELPATAIRPDAPDYQLRADGRGVTIGSWPRRLVLAWALQAGRLLVGTPPSTRVHWHLDPEDRLQHLAPFADWDAPAARVIDGRLVWIADGYVSSATFPLAPRAEWRRRRVGAVSAGFLGTVDAESGETHVYLRAGADPLAEAWATIARGVVESAGAIPAGVLATTPYPTSLLRVQARLLEAPRWAAGTLGARGDTAGDPSGPALELDPAPDGVSVTVPYEHPAGQQLSALLVGARREGSLSLQLLRLDSAAALPVRVVLENRWKNFPSFQALAESVQVAGSQLIPGPYRHWRSPAGLVAYEPLYAGNQGRPARLVWVNVAAGSQRLGAGRTLAEAWGNLRGETVPTLPVARRPEVLEEARRWLHAADSAIRRGDWAGFGRAFDALRQVLDLPSDTAPQ